MSATKQDYEAIAAVFRRMTDGTRKCPVTDASAQATIIYCRELASGIANHFAKNPKFDREEFLRDCGVQS